MEKEERLQRREKNVGERDGKEEEKNIGRIPSKSADKKFFSQQLFIFSERLFCNALRLSGKALRSICRGGKKNGRNQSKTFHQRQVIPQLDGKSEYFL